MSSNMIKAYSIAYDMQKIKPLDMEERENELLERVRKLIPTAEVFKTLPESEEFVQGIPVTTLEEPEPQMPPVISEQDKEAMRQSLREEIMAEMSTVLQRKGDDIVATARAQAAALLEAAKKDAEVAKENILKDASTQGYEEGKKRAKEEETKALAELELQKIRLQKQYEEKIAELEPAFARVLIELVKKVTNVAYENHTEVLQYLLETGLGFAQRDTYFDVILSEGDYKKYADLFPKLQGQYKDKFALEFIKSAELPDGSCKLENENRVIECGVGIRLGGLLEELELLG